MRYVARVRGTRTVAVLLGVVLVVVVAWMLSRLASASAQLDELRSRSGAQAATIGRLSAGLESAQAQLQARGVQPSGPSSEQVQRGAAGSAGGGVSPGPSATAAAGVAAESVPAPGATGPAGTGLAGSDPPPAGHPVPAPAPGPSPSGFPVPLPTGVLPNSVWVTVGALHRRTVQ